MVGALGRRSWPRAAGHFDANGQADPSVIYDGPGHWQMWFDAYDGSAWRAIGYATSTDGLSWTKVGAGALPGPVGSWDKSYIHHPCVIKTAGTYYMYYAGHAANDTHNNIGLATSKDGVSWTKSGDSRSSPAARRSVGRDIGAAGGSRAGRFPVGDVLLGME